LVELRINQERYRLHSWVTTSQVAKLLVSVRSAIEAQAAVAGGAAIIDVKEPLHGPLGRAEIEVARQVRSAVARATVSVALGELNEWFLSGAPQLNPWAAMSIAYVKLGLSHARPGWREEWGTLRKRFSLVSSRTGLPSPAWIAVVYADWQKAHAPHPSEVLGEALEADTCHGVLFDTWDKEAPSPLDSTWKNLIDLARDCRSIALAGRIDVKAIERLASLEPDIIAVRGAACKEGDRLGLVDTERVARLAEAAARLPVRSIELDLAGAKRLVRRMGS
jgi:(5-formylfuran-3-yl)methyl phosphate synthase